MNVQPPTKLYLVLGEKGEYSDHREWVVAAYGDKVQADRHAKEANKEATKLWKKYWSAKTTNEEKSKLLNPFDPVESLQFGDKHNYSVEQIDLFAHFDQFQEFEGI